MASIDSTPVERTDTGSMVSRNTVNTANTVVTISRLSVAHSTPTFSPSTIPEASRTSFSEKRRFCRVIVNDVDCTPGNLTDPDYVSMDDHIVHAAFQTRQRIRSDVIRPTKSIIGDLGMKVYATTINLDDIHIDHTMNTEEGMVTVDPELEQAPSAFQITVEADPMTYPPSIFLVLKETDTCVLYSLPSFSLEKGTAGAAAVEKENEYYSYITVGKGRNRKMVHEETQTQSYITQSRHTLATRPQKKNAGVFASQWDMYDTYAQLALHQQKEEPDEMVMYQSAASHLLRKKKPKVVTIIKDNQRRFEELASTPQFKDAVLLTERVLAAIQYGNQQKKFRGLEPMNPLSLDLVYVYTMKPLWTLECEETVGKPVCFLSVNPKNENILATCHGKFEYAGKNKGMVCVWCTKNPCRPERVYRFDDPLTSLAFATKNPNWLACGFFNGDCLILDITSYTIKTIAKSKRETNPCFEPIWTVSWRFSENKEIEHVVTSCQDGRINQFTTTKTHDFICSPMMRVTSVEGKTRGLEVAKNCIKVDVPITRYPAALCLLWHPHREQNYLVGTDEGYVHKCSTHYLNQHMDVFKAHAGPVYMLCLSPFMKTLLMTCGADNAIRMWIEGIDEVIMTLTCESAVYDMSFCPTNSTLLVSVSGNVLSVWDVRRKTHMPCTEYAFPGNAVLTYVKFASSGDSVFVGDNEGRVHTFHLEDTPIPPYYQKKLLEEAIKKALCTRPRLLKQLEKLTLFTKHATKSTVGKKSSRFK